MDSGRREAAVGLAECCESSERLVAVMPSPSPPSAVHRVAVRPIQVAEKRTTPPSALLSSSLRNDAASISPSSSPLFSASTSVSASTSASASVPVVLVSERSSSTLPVAHSSLSALRSSSSASSSSSAASLLSVHSTVAFQRSSSRCSTATASQPSPPTNRTAAAEQQTSNLNVRCGHYSMQGLRAEMEDKVVLLPHPQFNSAAELQDGVPRSYFAVFDGHGGDVSAEYCLTEDMEVLTDRGFMSRAQVFAGCPELAASTTVPAFSSLRFASLNPSTGHLLYLPATALTVKTVTSLVEFTQAAEAAHWAADADEYGLTPDEVARMQARSDHHRDGGEVLEPFAAEQLSNGVSLVVDPHHDMFARVGAAGHSGGGVGEHISWQSTDYRKVKAGSLLSDDVWQRVQMTGQAAAGVVASAGELPFTRVLGLTTEEQVTAFLLLYGYWCGDGHLHRAVCFAPKKEADKKWVLDQLTAVGLTVESGLVHADDMAGGRLQITVLDPRWVGYFSAEYEYGAKYGSDPIDMVCTQPNIESVKWFWQWVWQLRKERARLVLAGLRFAAGKERSDVKCVHTSDVSFRDEIVRLALHAGYSARFNLNHKKGDHRGYDDAGRAIIAQHDGWAVSYSDHFLAAQPLLSNHTDIRRLAVPGGAQVWCPTVPPHNLIIARRVTKSGTGCVTHASRPLVVGNCKQHVHLNFLAEASFSTAPSKALHNALLRTDNEFCAACRRINLMSSSGTTALCAFIQRSTLTVANVGDSRAILVKRSGAMQPLSCDHKPGRKDEKARIEALGGRVAVSEEDAWADRSSQTSCTFLSSCFPSTRPLRVFPGGLSVSRTIGDIGVKGMKLVIAEAEVWEADLRAADDLFVVMGCDGVWDVLSNQHVADLCKKWEDKQQQSATKGGKLDELAECIAKEAFKRGSSDNISVVIIKLDWSDTQPLEQEQKEQDQQHKAGSADGRAASKVRSKNR